MTAVELLVGLDVGTTSSKAVVFGTDGAPLAVGRATTPWRSVEVIASGSHPMRGTELHADELLDAVRTALSRALAGAPEGRVAGLGVTSMGESGVLLDSHGEPVAPVIAWHDSRDVREVAELGRALGEEGFSSRTGLPLRSQWSLTKHRWQLDNDPGAASAVTRLNIAEWIVRCLGGEEASDASLASRTGWLDLSSRSWWNESLDWSGASASLLPPLVTSGTNLGRVRIAAGVERLAGAVLTTAGHDHQAAAIGADAAGPGDQLDSCGTAEALVRTVPAPFPALGVARLAQAGVTVGWHVVDDRWALLGATEGGLALARVLSLFGGSHEVLAQLDAAALDVTPGAVTVVVDDTARVTVGGIGDAVTAGDVWRATLETITDQILDIHRSMTSVVGPHRNMIVTGGWSRSAALMQVKQRAFGDLTRCAVEEAGARGAALLAGLAAGTYAGVGDFPDTHLPDTHLPDTHLPDTDFPDTDFPGTELPA
jgi:sugar (pentulose or hexulose) kinase